MKKIIVSHILGASFCLASTATAAITQQWEFDDATSVLLENATNSGTPGGVSYNSGLTHTTDGSDFYVINQNSTGFKTANIPDVSSGQLYYRMDMNGWNLDDNATFRNMNFHLRAAGVNPVDFQFNQLGNGNVRFRYSDNNGISNAVISGFDTGDLSNVTSNTYSIILGLDIASANYNISISTNGGAYVEAVTGTASAATITDIRFAVSNGDYSTMGDFVNIGYLGLSNDAADFGGIAVVPEPSSAALLGLGGLALILRRRK